jgi:hypothetical protein
MTRSLPRGRSGITLTEILIAILILGVGMVSLATLFPLGLLRLRTAQRLTRSAYLFESAANDLGTRNLLNKLSFKNYYYSPWYNVQSGLTPSSYDPWVQDTPSYGADPYAAPSGVSRSVGVGLPVAYDPLWRWQTGVYLNPGTTLEARFGNGQGYVQVDSDGFVAADGLQRLTNFNPALYANTSPTPPTLYSVPDIFVSPEDVVWEDSAGKQGATNVSPIMPDLLVSMVNGVFAPNIVNGTLTTNDWRYSWMVTGQQADANNGTVFDADVVIHENRQFGINAVTAPIGGGTTYQVEGEIVVEGIFGYGVNVFPQPQGVSRGADNVVLLRWPAGMPDPPITVGSWFADITYTRSQAASLSRQSASVSALAPLGMSVTPPQRCYWYQIAKRSEPVNDLTFPGYRSMTVWTTTPLRAKTLLNAGSGAPVYFNTALIAPTVVNVFSKTFYSR